MFIIKLIIGIIGVLTCVGALVFDHYRGKNGKDGVFDIDQYRKGGM